MAESIQPTVMTANPTKLDGSSMIGGSAKALILAGISLAAIVALVRRTRP